MMKWTKEDCFGNKQVWYSQKMINKIYQFCVENICDEEYCKKEDCECAPKLIKDFIDEVNK